jgi:hypothetical protein
MGRTSSSPASAGAGPGFRDDGGFCGVEGGQRVRAWLAGHRASFRDCEIRTRQISARDAQSWPRRNAFPVLHVSRREIIRRASAETDRFCRRRSWRIWLPSARSNVRMSLGGGALETVNSLCGATSAICGVTDLALRFMDFDRRKRVSPAPWRWRSLHARSFE